MRALLIAVLALGCAAQSDDPWVYRYRMSQVPQAQGCTVAGSTNHDLVRLEGPTCDEHTWCHPCQDGTPGLCVDLSGPGMWVDVYSRESVENPEEYITLEACR